MGPLWGEMEKNFCSKWYILAYFIFLGDGGAPKRRGALGSLPLRHPFDGSDLNAVVYLVNNFLQ